METKPASAPAMLEGFTPRPGGHCESSAMLNALAYLGYGFTEADIIGGGAAPSFMFTDSSFPFLGGRNRSMRELFFSAAGLPWKVVVPAKAKPEWTQIEDLLRRGLPVLLRVDMRYLPYLYGGKNGPAYMSFGWHWVCLIGMDRTKGRAFVTDTAHEEAQGISLKSLETARLSATKVWPPRGEYAWIEAKPETWRLDPDALARKGLAGVLVNYDGGGEWAEGPGKASLEGLKGLGQLPERLSRLDASVKAFTLAPAWSYLAASIERNGTGGGAFRKLFAAFLEARAGDCVEPGLRTACAGLLPLAREAAQAWTALSRDLDEAAQGLQAARGGGKRKAAIAAGLTATAAGAEKIVAIETRMRDALGSISPARPPRRGSRP